MLGNQKPRVELIPSSAWSHADDCSFLATSYGLTPDPWQFLVLEAWLGERKNKKWSAGRCGLAVPRQNGKNGALEMVELYKIVVLGRKILHTAHEVKTTRKAFLRLKSFFENERKWPELAALVSEIRQTNGQEAIVLTNGGSVEFIARSRGSGRGYTVDDLVCDEAQELTDEQLEALLPTISAAPSGNPQQIYTGTPPSPNSPGTVFQRMRNSGVKGADKRLAWLEWSVDKIGDIRDRLRWADTNPAYGTRLQASVIEDELEQMSEDGFARERLGLWPSESATHALIDTKSWADCGTKDPPLEGDMFFGIRFSPDGSTVAISGALLVDDLPVHVELIDEQSMSRGTEWLVDWIVQRERRGLLFVMDGKGERDVVVNALVGRRFNQKRLLLPSTNQAIAAHAMFFDAVKAQKLSHFIDPGQTALDESVGHAIKRPIGQTGGWGWKAFGNGDALPIESATLAHYGAVSATTKKRRTGASVFR